MKKEDINFKLFTKYFIDSVYHIRSNMEIVLKIIIPLFIILFGYFACSYNQRKINLNIDNIFNIANDIRLSYSDKPDYWGLSTDFVIKNKLIDSKFINKNRIYLDKDKEIFVGYGINSSPVLPLQKSFDIVLKNLNKAECISYLEVNITQQNQVNLSKISVINSNQYIFNWGDKTYSLPVEKYTGKDVCSDENNAIIWSIF